MAKGIQKAITAGIERAATSGLTKVYDVAICVQVELDKAGLKVVRKPRKDGLAPDPQTFLFNCDCGFSINLFGSEIHPTAGVRCLSSNCNEAMFIDDKDRESLAIHQGDFKSAF
jgi:hypothetical protein